MVICAHREKDRAVARSIKRILVDGKEIPLNDCYKVDTRRRLVFCFDHDETGAVHLNADKTDVARKVIRGRIQLFY